MPSAATRDTGAHSAFVTLLREAVAARAGGAMTDEAQCFEAAVKLHALDGRSLVAQIAALLVRERLVAAIELAAIIAQLDPGSAVAPFRAGYA